MELAEEGALQEEVDGGEQDVAALGTLCVPGDAEAFHHRHALHCGQHPAHRLLPRTFRPVLK